MTIAEIEVDTKGPKALICFRSSLYLSTNKKDASQEIAYFTMHIILV